MSGQAPGARLRSLVERGLGLEAALLERAAPWVLLGVRLVVGLGLAQAGLGKWRHFDRTTAFFASLGLPLPALQVVLAASTELAGGLLLAAGLGTRVVAIPLVFTMLVAYGTAHRDAFGSIEAFAGAPPFPFLCGALLGLFAGPGALALDRRLAPPQPVRSPGLVPAVS